MPKRKRPAPRVTDAELAVLEELWKADGLTIRQITIRYISEQLYPGGGTSEYATVQKLLERLESKKCVERDRRGFVHTFRARIARADVIDQQLAEVADKLCDGSLTPLLLHLVAKQKLSREDREMLRRLIEER